MPALVPQQRLFVADMFHAGVNTQNGARRLGGDFDASAASENADGAGASLPLRPEEGQRILQLLRAMRDLGDEVPPVEIELPNGRALRRRVSCQAMSAHDIAVPAGRDVSITAELRFASEGGGYTPVKVRLRWTNSGATCWLNLQANPTTLLVRTNAFAAATGLPIGRERVYLFQFPFFLFERAMRALAPSFRWSDATAARIKAGELSLHNVQLAAYLRFADAGGARRFLHCLRAVYCTPIVDERWSSFQLGKFIGLKADAMTDDHGDLTGIMFRAHRNSAGNADMVVNIYYKPAALGDAAMALLDGAQLGWLARRLRLDLTLHPPAIRRFLRKAGVPASAGLTAASWCRALAAFPGGGVGFRDWLLRAALVDKLKLVAVARFRPGRLERAREKLSRRPRLMAVWDDWVAGLGDLRRLLAAKLPDPVAVRAEIHAARKAGLDPDLPPPLLHRLAMIASLWGFSAAQAREYSEALAAGNGRAWRRLLRHNRKFVATSQRDFSRAVGAALRAAPVPAISVR